MNLVCVRRHNFDNLPALPDISPLTIQKAWHIEGIAGNDTAAWYDLMQKSFGREMDIAAILFNQPVLDITHTYFLMDGTRYIGVISEGNFRKNSAIGTLHFLGLDPDYLNRGLGKYLMLYGYHQMKAHGYSCFEGETTVEHRRALEIHFDLGCIPKYKRDDWNSPNVGDPAFQHLYENWARVPFTRPAVTDALTHLEKVWRSGKMSGAGVYTEKCERWLEANVPCRRALLTHSCTGALDLAAMLLDIKPGDEVIVPSFTFVSTANAFVLRGAIPIFIDIRPDTLNLDERLLETAITRKTRAIVPVHYGGMHCNMNAIREIADRYRVNVVEDAAQSLPGDRNFSPGGQLVTLSFHNTKNIVSGEGGALLIQDPALIKRAEVMRECGTDRQQFLHGEVDKYTWQDIGSSFLPSELQAAVLWSQLEQAHEITQKRRSIWYAYHNAFMHRATDGTPMSSLPGVQIPFDVAGHNAHNYWLLVPPQDRARILTSLRKDNIEACFHYIPLHSSPAGRKFGLAHNDLPVTNRVSESIIRLPLWSGMTQKQVDYVILRVKELLG